MTREQVWSCPLCGTEMFPGKSALLRSWHCPGCGVDWVPGEALAAFVSTAKAFEEIRAAAGAGQSSTRVLHCPRCRTRSLRIVEAAGVLVDVCPECVGVVLDPGELRRFKSIGLGRPGRACDDPDVLSRVVSGTEALAHALTQLW
jgi:Zn-finger nucleic acid-binding protein